MRWDQPINVVWLDIGLLPLIIGTSLYLFVRGDASVLAAPQALMVPALFPAAVIHGTQGVPTFANVVAFSLLHSLSIRSILSPPWWHISSLLSSSHAMWQKHDFYCEPYSNIHY